MNKPDARRRLRAEIRAAADTLRRDWDPIGGGEMADLPADEYDTYAPRIVALIEAGADDNAIAAYLRNLEETTIEVSSGRDLLVVASALRRAVAAVPYRAG